MSTTAAATDGAPAPSRIPVNAVGDTPVERRPELSSTQADRNAAVIALARALPGADAPAETAAPASAAKTEPAKDAKPAETPVDGKKDEPRAATVTQRIADLTRANRELKAAAAAAEARAAQVSAAMEEAKKGGAQLEAVKAAFAKDPLEAFKLLGEEWRDIVARVASGGTPPTPEEVASAERERKAAEADARLKKLEEEREAEKKLAAERQAEAEMAGAVKFVAERMISAETYPTLARLDGEDIAREALDHVEEALALAFKEKRRATRDPQSLEESQRLTHLALKGLETYYSDLYGRLAPRDAATQQQSSAAGTQPATTATTPAATSAAPPAAIQDSATQQHRPITTLTNATAGGTSRQVVQPRQMSADEARERAVQAARSLPPLG